MKTILKPPKKNKTHSSKGKDIGNPVGNLELVYKYHQYFATKEMKYLTFKQIKSVLLRNIKIID